ncbi:MAG: winged helix DNA-binding domain-containing protein [Anaerolineales bacterium]|nr:winged helix DNA-binding domain-containing protein [Anaerolineales bacterium]
MTLSAKQIRWFRLRRSGLVEPLASPEAAAAALAGVQAQILPAAGLALWNRTTGLTYPAFDDLLHRRRSLVKLWGQRHTLHLYPSHEWPLIHGALAGRLTWWERQAVKNGIDPATYRATIVRLAALLQERGTLGRSDLRAAELDLDEEHFSSWGGIFASLVREGHACHAGQVGNEGRFAHREYWLPDLAWNPPPALEANAELARRYLAVYGPATVQDLAYWRGASVSEARRWLAALSDEVTEVEGEGQALLALRADIEVLHETPPLREAWPVRLLYRFDPLLLGVKEKSWVVDPAHYSRVWRPAGHIEGTVLEHGRIVGTWRYDWKGRDLAVSVFPFDPWLEHVRTAVASHAAGVAAFFGVELADFVTL